MHVLIAAVVAGVAMPAHRRSATGGDRAHRLALLAREPAGGEEMALPCSYDRAEISLGTHGSSERRKLSGNLGRPEGRPKQSLRTK